MKFVMMRCCTTPIVLPEYEWSTNAVMEKLGIELIDVAELGCCGYPLRNISFRAHILASARNLALTEKENLDLLTVCNCCYGTLRYVDNLMKNDASIRKEVNTTLEKEGLKYEGDIQAKHILQVLYDDVGIETIRDMIVKPFDGLRIATHYGCRILRPSKVAQFDKPHFPTKFDELVEVTGAQSIEWPKKLECCGSPLWGINNELSLDLTESKLKGAKESGADYLCVACSYCQIQFDRVQRILLIQRGPGLKLPSVLYPQLLGLSLGIDGETLGLQMNKVSITDIEFFLYHRAATEA
jgi:heterodisulfide reductase subunit B